MVGRWAHAALHVGVPVGKKTARTRLPGPDVEIPDAEALRLLQGLPHDARRLGGCPGGDRHDEFDAIQFESAVRLLLVHQYLWMVEIERRVAQRRVLKVVAHGARWLMLDAVRPALVARRLSGLRCLEPRGRLANRHDVAIDGLAKRAWKDSRHLAHL